MQIIKGDSDVIINDALLGLLKLSDSTKICSIPTQRIPKMKFPNSSCISGTKTHVEAIVSVTEEMFIKNVHL